MTTTAYLDQVRAALADVPAGERDELLADVESSLVEGEGPPEERLGPPERFARELRLAAGLEPAPPHAARRWATRLRALAGRGSMFAPLWWVARAYVAVAALGLLLGSTWPDRPVHFLPMLHSGRFTIAACAIALVASLWLGARRPAWQAGVNVLLAVAALPVLVHDIDTRAWETPPPPATVTAAPVASGLDYNGNAVANVYAYDRTGRLLHDVRLYDQAGRPLNVGARDPGADPLRRIVRSRGGAIALNAFPIRYVEPGTRRVAHPDAAPRARVAPLR